jgi:hypothetical protein
MRMKLEALAALVLAALVLAGLSQATTQFQS